MLEKFCGLKSSNPADTILRTLGTRSVTSPACSFLSKFLVMSSPVDQSSKVSFCLIANEARTGEVVTFFELLVELLAFCGKLKSILHAELE